MRIRSMFLAKAPRAIGSLAIAGWLLCGTALVSPGQAQQVRSADQILRDLTPTAAMLGGPTRGIRPVGPATAPSAIVPSSATSAVTSAAPRAAPAAHAAAPTSNLPVQFPNGSAELTPQAVQALNELGKALSDASLATYRFRIEGHTDTVGSPEMNKQLSERRAQVVAQYLSSKFGIAATRMEPVGLGSEHPLVQTAQQTAEPRNRRVMVVNLGA